MSPKTKCARCLWCGGAGKIRTVAAISAVRRVYLVDAAATVARMPYQDDARSSFVKRCKRGVLSMKTTRALSSMRDGEILYYMCAL